MLHRSTFTSTKVTILKNGAKWTKTRLKTHPYAPISQKHFSESKSDSLNAVHEQKTSLAQEKLVHKTIFLTFTIRSKRRLHK